MPQDRETSLLTSPPALSHGEREPTGRGESEHPGMPQDAAGSVIGVAGVQACRSLPQGCIDRQSFRWEMAGALAVSAAGRHPPQVSIDWPGRVAQGVSTGQLRTGTVSICAVRAVGGKVACRANSIPGVDKANRPRYTCVHGASQSMPTYCRGDQLRSLQFTDRWQGARPLKGLGDVSSAATGRYKCAAIWHYLLPIAQRSLLSPPLSRLAPMAEVISQSATTLDLAVTCECVPRAAFA
jgi:hypothetical protein